MKRHITLEVKEAIVKQALDGSGRRLTEIAATNNIGYSTLQRWLRAKRAGQPFSTHKASSSGQGSEPERFKHLIATANLDETAVSVYCRREGIYNHQLVKWKEEFMADTNDKSHKKQLEELRGLKKENKGLRKDLHRKDKALAETSALLILKKKADLIWGDHEGD